MADTPTWHGFDRKRDLPLLGVDPDAPPVEVKYDPSLDRKDNRDPVTLVEHVSVDGNGSFRLYVPRVASRHPEERLIDREVASMDHRQFMARERQRLARQAAAG